ncbi:peptidoglycan D,D-transpeptidase FtsI family protein [Oceanobacillus polygoni]|uniref:serine-type D-Ala-D-Ala carboxypeptidase n=1 Tax=Oceanobacillus polygoni TaxID=1235259 RepID=A0A9X0YT65_9BACI|nr:penicillin-binding protein 2 [Oceanobacillus polygoni]MBP2078184.1 cell division protein FtsI/penicillin-binding protein 2 [Oceanobacillus polygoni]
MSKKKKKKRAQLPFRINMLFFVVFLLFSVLILQLGVVQILNGEDFQQEIERTNLDTTKIPVPRGKIYDRNGNVIVDNEAVYSITYTPPKGVQAEDRLELAEKLAAYIEMDDEDTLKGVTERNRKEYWYLLNKEEADDRLSDEEKENMTNAEVYQETLALITEDEIKDFSKEELEVIAIKKELDKAYSLTPQIVKNKNVTAKEYATIAENLAKLPGINATTDWNRKYPYGSTLKSLLGSITTQEQGIPAEEEANYLSKGYSRNDRVGKSGLELQYEDLLRGRKEQIQYTTTKSGAIIGSETIVQGERGKDLVLSIDMEFQEEVDKIVQKELQTAITTYPHANRYLEDALAVVIDPQTGDLLAVSGIHYDRENGEYVDAAFKTLSDAHEPGSVVKGATVLAGLQSGVITPGQTFYDSPIRVAQTPPLRSASSNIGTMDDITALKRSSNVYMGYIALKMMGENRYPYPENAPLSINDNWQQGFQEMRNYFRQFGLGSSTGIDFPHESTGLEGTIRTPGELMYNAIGQFDTFTTMQLAQYTATIANDGYRVRPHFLKEAHDPIASQDELGPLYSAENTEVLNRIQMSDDNIKRVQEGFRQVFQTSGGTAYGDFGNSPYNPAGKTGTAETAVYMEGQKLADTRNLALIGYAPFDEPEIAFAILTPYTGTDNNHSIPRKIGTQILETYFDLKEKRDKASDEDSDQEETTDEEEQE